MDQVWAKPIPGTAKNNNPVGYCFGVIVRLGYCFWTKFGPNLYREQRKTITQRATVLGPMACFWTKFGPNLYREQRKTITQRAIVLGSHDLFLVRCAPHPPRSGDLAIAENWWAQLARRLFKVVCKSATWLLFVWFVLASRRLLCDLMSVWFLFVFASAFCLFGLCLGLSCVRSLVHASGAPRWRVSSVAKVEVRRGGEQGEHGGLGALGRQDCQADRQEVPTRPQPGRISGRFAWQSSLPGASRPPCSRFWLSAPLLQLDLTKR